MGTRLYIGNLSFQTTDAALQQHFGQAGSVTSVDLIMDKFTGRSRGFAFIEMGAEADAQKAIEMFHGKDLDGRVITVNEARPREERPSGGGGGGGRREHRGGGGGGGRGGHGGHERRDH
jgi:cold-inducible RNA-binding protein